MWSGQDKSQRQKTAVFQAVVPEKAHYENLEECPDVISSDFPRPVIVVGDLNGSALFAMNAAMAHGLLSLSEDKEEAKRRYGELVEIYKNLNIAVAQENDALAKKYIARFKEILIEAKFNEQAQIFIGDTVADRGGLYGPKNDYSSLGNDYLTLYFFYQLLLNGKGSHSKIASNHDIWFFHYWNEYINGRITSSDLTDTQYNTVKYFIILIEKGIIQKEEAIKLVDAHKRSTKLFDYIYDEQAKSFELMVHAPCGLETVWAAAKYYKLNSSDFGLTTWKLTEDTAKKLSVAVIKSVIDRVNQEFLLDLFRGPKRIKYYIDHVSTDERGKFIATNLDYPITRAMFNRVVVDEDGQRTDKAETQREIVPAFIANGEIRFGVNHGHDGIGNVSSPHKNMFNYNNHVGKWAKPGNRTLGDPLTVKNGIGSLLPVELPPKPKTMVAVPLEVKDKAPPSSSDPAASGRSGAPPESTVTIHTTMAAAQPAEFKMKSSELTVFNEQRERLYTLLEEQQKSDKSILKKAEEISCLMKSEEMKSFRRCLRYNPLEDSILTIKIAEISPLSLTTFFGRHLDVLRGDQVMNAINAIEISEPAPSQTEVKSQENFADLIPQTLTALKELAASKAKALLTEIIDDYEDKAAKDKEGWHGSLANKVKLFNQDVEDKAVSVERLVYDRILDTKGGFRDDSLNTLFLKKLATDGFLRKILHIPESIDLSPHALNTNHGRQNAAKDVKSVLEESLGLQTVKVFSQSTRLGFRGF